MSTPMDTIETGEWSNRDLMLKIYHQTVEINGTVRQHDRTLYGDKIHGLCGLVEEVQLNKKYREQLKTVIRVVYILGGTAISTIIGLLALIAARGL